MTLQSQSECEATREKLRLLEEQYALMKAKPEQDERVQELTLRSLKRLVNRLTEEIVRFEASSRAAGPNALPIDADRPVAEHRQPTGEE
jgi:hypothetical protein